MRREDVRPLLEQAVGQPPVPDLADAAWAGGLEVRRRRRRGIALMLAVAVLIGAAAVALSGAGGNRAEPVPPSVPPSTAFGYVPPSGSIGGIDFWYAPPAGSEPYLDRLVTPLGNVLRVPDDPPKLADRPVEDIAAILLQQEGTNYRPLLLAADGRWAEADLELSAISTGSPLSPGAVSPDGRLVAFPQPGELVVLDGPAAAVRRIAIPSPDLRAVSWLPDSHRVLVSGKNEGKDEAYRVLAGPDGQGEQTLALIPAGADPGGVTAPYRLEGVGEQASLLRYVATGWTVQSAVRVPVTSWEGQTFTAGGRVARLFHAPRLSQVPTVASQPQVVAVVSTQRSIPTRLLVLTETRSNTPGRTKPEEVRVPGCCRVLGWYDDQTVLIQVVGVRDGWILAWDVQSGEVRRVTELAAGPIALGPGIRG